MTWVTEREWILNYTLSSIWELNLSIWQTFPCRQTLEKSRPLSRSGTCTDFSIWDLSALLISSQFQPSWVVKGCLDAARRNWMAWNWLVALVMNTAKWLTWQSKILPCHAPLINWFTVRNNWLVFDTSSSSTKTRGPTQIRLSTLRKKRQYQSAVISAEQCSSALCVLEFRKGQRISIWHGRVSSI